MASNAPSQCCTKGVRHEGKLSGESIKIGPYKGYISLAAGGNAHRKVGLLMMPDIMGIYSNSQLLADSFARSGYTCLLLDVFDGDALELNTIMSGFDIKGWIDEGREGRGPHRTQEVDPIIVAGIQHLRGLGCEKVGGVGYCFGAKYVVRHYRSGIDVGFIAHPSWVEEDELAAITGPLSIAAAQDDDVFPVKKRQISEVILLKTGQPFQINLFSGSGVGHGFAIRGHLEGNSKFAYEQAFTQAVGWFDRFLV